MGDGEFNGRPAGRAAGEHIAGVTNAWEKFVGDEPDRLMHLAAQTGFILPSDTRYQRFLTPEQIDHFNQNMADNADLVRAHAEEYRRDRTNASAQANELHLKQFLETSGLGDPTGMEAFFVQNDPAKAKTFNDLRKQRWMAGGAQALNDFGKRVGWTPEETDARRRMLDMRFGVAPGPGDVPPPASGPMPPAFNAAMPSPAAPAASTARAMSGPPANSLSLAQAFGPLTPQERTAGQGVEDYGVNRFRSMFGLAPRPKPQAPPPILKQPGEPGALTPEAQRAIILSLGQ